MSDIEWLIAREIPHLRRYARALARNSADADDLVQETLTKALGKKDHWRRSGNIRAWLFTILYRSYLNSIRGGKRVTVSDDAVQNALSEERHATAPPQEEGFVWRDLGRALDRLPDNQRAALLLIALEDLSYEEAASVLEIPIGTLRSRLARARGTLRATMDPALQARTSIRRVK